MNHTCPSILHHLPSSTWILAFSTTQVLLSASCLLCNGYFFYTVAHTYRRTHRLDKLFILLAFIESTIALIVGPCQTLQLLLPNLQSNRLYDQIRIFLTTTFISLDFNLLGLLARERYDFIYQSHNSQRRQFELRYLVSLCIGPAILIPSLRLIPHPIATITHLALSFLTGLSVAVLLIFTYASILSSYYKAQFMPSPATERSLRFSVGRVITLHVLVLLPLIAYPILLVSRISDCTVLAKFYTIGLLFFLSTGVLHPFLYSFHHSSAKTYIRPAQTPRLLRLTRVSSV